MLSMKSIRLLLFAIPLFALIGCSQTAVPNTTTPDETVTQDGRESGQFDRTLQQNDELLREYILYIPESTLTEEEVPLLFNLHGFTGTSTSQLNYADFRAIADEEGFILVYPQGTLLDGEDTHWNVGGWTLSSTTDDVEFFDMLIDDLAEDYNIDLDRVYATGHSNGGYMSFLLACQMSDQITAVASMAGSMTPQTMDDCDPQRPVPVLQIHGTRDGTVPYNGASWSESIDDVLTYWVEKNGLAIDGTQETIPANPDTTANSSIEHIRYGDSDTDMVVEHLQVVGGDHEWLGQENGRGQVNVDLDLNRYIWAFFERYELDGRAE